MSGTPCLAGHRAPQSPAGLALGQVNIGQNCFQLHLFHDQTHLLSITDQDAHFYRQWTVPDTLSGTGYMFRVLTCDHRYYADSPRFPIISAKPDLMVAQHSVTPVNAAIPGGLASPARRP
jgi:hypothetical protein